MLFESLDYPNFRAFVRLIQMRFNVQRKPDATSRKRLITLANNHGISRDEAQLVLDLCLN